MKEYLKVKVLSLIAERRIIKTQADRVSERQVKRKRFLEAGNPDRQKLATASAAQWRDGAVRSGLWRHEEELSRESRLTGLAYGFIRGRSYPQMEAKLRYHGDKTKNLTEDDLKRILTMVEKYDEKAPDTAQRWSKFLIDVANVPVVRAEAFSAYERRKAYRQKWTPEARAAAAAKR